MFTFKVITPQGIFFEKEVSIINIVTIDGQIGILKEHIPLVTPCGTGIMEIKTNVTEKYYVDGGFIYTSKKETVLITDSIKEVDGEIH